ncbi:D-aminoacyl-tRNA deacylase-like isoform X2 [Mercurialis annua]|uniref:D-aminoacyl-tRNA deacylase-like isoform X2 n=1 Tax=Mercurialis annua TaxID=3986 RepID=UPI00215E2B46|nr:D-aminoacyl-tRNA deacylase-like isoform X2 [Mercurialis annua]
MVTLVVATAVDPASIGPASALLAMPGWHPGPTWQEDAQSFVNKNVRLIKLETKLVKEDDLDKRWEEATGESVDEIIFLSKHVAASNRPALTIHPIGTPHVTEGEVLVAGGKPRWAAPPNPRIGPWLRLLRCIAASHNLSPEFEVVQRSTGGGRMLHRPLLWNDSKNKILLGIGGGHYVPRHMDVVLKDGVWVGHLLSGYSLLMEDPAQLKALTKADAVKMTWKEAIKVAFEATKLAFPGGEVIAHLDHKSFKSWQRNAVTSFLVEQNIKIGKPGDF